MPFLIFGADRQVADFVENQLGQDVSFSKDFSAIGVGNEQGLVAGVVYNNFEGRDIQSSIASTSPNWASRGVLYAIFAYPFLQLKCARLSALTRSQNVKSNIFLRKAGFRQEGLLRNWYEDDDAIVYGMLKNECIWIKTKNK